MKLLPLVLLILTGCAGQLYRCRDTGTTYVAISVLMNDQINKFVIDRQTTKNGKHHQGIGIASIGLDVDNASIEAITKGVTEGVIKGMK